MPYLNTNERDDFLAERGILMRIAWVDDDGAPAVTPIWFLHEDGALYFTPRAHSAWLPRLRVDPRVALCIDEQPLPYRKVLVKGSAELVHDLGEDNAWRDRYRRIAGRYVPPDAANAYVDNTDDQPRALFRVVLADCTVTTWRMPLADEPQEGIWHDRYYAPGSRFAADTRGE